VSLLCVWMCASDMRTHKFVCMGTYTGIYGRAVAPLHFWCEWSCMCIYVCAKTCLRVRPLYVYIHTHTHTYIYIYTHTRDRQSGEHSTQRFVQELFIIHTNIYEYRRIQIVWGTPPHKASSKTLHHLHIHTHTYTCQMVWGTSHTKVRCIIYI
jgi:hypothetical protein